MANKRIYTSALDFDAIKASLKAHLQGQDKFTDYDFEGSGLSILLDVLAYNTHYNALYTNLAVNEAFLDSASKRSSVVSRAKELGYTPRSAISSSATVRLIITVPSEYAGTTLTIPKSSVFSSVAVGGSAFSFVTIEDLSAPRVENTFTFDSITIKEGVALEYRFTVQPGAKFIIPNKNVDISSLVVRVQDNSQSSNFTTFIHNDQLIDVGASTLAFFVKETEGSLYELEFGNDIVGKQLSSGNVVVVRYLTCSSASPNGVGTFSYQGVLPAGAYANTITIARAFGGSDPETVDSIKWNAPRTFAAQNRCVTAEDFRTVITSRYPNIDSINVWGGEQNDPPSYGDVYISIKPSNGTVLSEGERDFILKDILGPRKIMTIHPKLVDPTYINVELYIAFYFNQNNTNKTPSELTTLVRDTVMDYNTTYLREFGGVLRYSNLSRLVDTAEPSIVSCIITTKIHRSFDVVYNKNVDYIINIANPIYNSGVPEQSILSTAFTPQDTDKLCFIDDVPTENTTFGVLRMFHYAGNKKVKIRDVGTVDYATGTLKIVGLIISSVEGSDPSFAIKTQSNDIVSARNQIVLIDERRLTINAVLSSSTDSYKFTSSRN